MDRINQMTTIGTFPFMAPELFSSQFYGTSADTYSLGMVLLAVAASAQGGSLDDLWEDPWSIPGVVRGDRPVLPPSLQDMGELCWLGQLIKSCWDQDAEKRPTMKEVKQRIIEATSSASPSRQGRRGKTVQNEQ